jgi:pimeloyl-ACP methyl ester carboxylesterase
MPLVLVHGNPETDAIWDELRTHLGRDDVLALSPPGFGAPVTEGFAATSDDYVRWLVAEIERIGSPVDLVGHDWGGGHVLRLACSRPDLLRSWASDIAGCFDPEYVWHAAAQAWQTPDVGEQVVAQMVATPATERAVQFQSLGMSEEVARRNAAAVNEDMARCILALYRSAAQPAMSRWGEELPKASARPGLVIIPTEDHYTGGEALARRSAARAGARVEVLSGRGHWWMCEDPERGAGVLNDFLDSLD